MLRLTFAFVSIFCLILFAEERPMVVGHKVISGREQASEERLMELYMALKEQVAGLDLAMTDREIKCLHGHRAVSRRSSFARDWQRWPRQRPGWRGRAGRRRRG